MLLFSIMNIIYFFEKKILKFFFKHNINLILLVSNNYVVNEQVTNNLELTCF